MKTIGRVALCLIGMLAGFGNGHAQPAGDNPAQRVEAEALNAERWEHLETLVDTISSTREQLVKRRAELGSSKDERERARLAEEVEQLSMDLESLQTAWEMMATGVIDLGQFGVKTEHAFNWRNELQTVFEPILVELRRLTERPRKIERLRTDQAYYQQRMGSAESALQSVVKYRESAPNPRLQEAFTEMERRWRMRRDDLNNRLSLVNYELKALLAPPKASQRDPVEALKELLSGRVTNLAIAVAVMVLVYLLLRLLNNIYNRIVMREPHMRRTYIARVGALLFYLSTTLLVLFSGMASLYVRDDWLLLGLFIIAMAGAAWAIQRSLPRVLMEARLILNLGPVREGERIIYNGLPWKVSALNFLATLDNPWLQGGALQLPIRELVSYHSRRYEESEPWFPSRLEDYVLLDDGTYGKVVTQTPETVQIQAQDALKSYGVSAFLDQNPRNLSQQGFTLVTTIGLDYQHQAEITTTIPERLGRALSEGIARSDVAKHLTQSAVEFQGAADSSLDLVAIATFRGEAAAGYNRIRRLLQGLIVEACNTHGWVIPYKQITVHMA